MGKRIGIMGGTFDPIHLGHMLIAENAYETFDLNEVLFIPSGNSYMKDNVTNVQTRVDMTGISIEDNSHFAMSTIEAERPGPSYTFETLSELKDKHPDNEYYFIVGADSFVKMDTWKNPEIIFSKAVILVAERIGNSSSEVTAKMEEYQKRFNADVRHLPINCIDISSTNIRKRVKEGKSIRYMVHYKVIEFINKKHLYK